MNLEIEVAGVDALHARAGDADVVLPLEERSYARGSLGDAIRVRQFAIADPDGYVLRFSQTMGTYSRNQRP